VKFCSTPIAGAYLIELDRMNDERGFFARTFCRDEFAAHGLHREFVQGNVSFNARKGTLRGLHFQARPHEEAKLVSCTRGAIYDVIVDLRRQSSSFRRWASFDLTAENHRLLYIPEGVAHGFQSIEDGTEVSYLMTEMYHPDLARGVRWNDPAFAIHWPIADRIVSARDAGYPDFVG
jgi:dTDP-4-dehydrorhamnose 3,5-epimerase